jgi:hypothetical protein
MNIKYIGMDVYKEAISIAVTECITFHCTSGSRPKPQNIDRSLHFRYIGRLFASNSAHSPRTTFGALHQQSKQSSEEQ